MASGQRQRQGGARHGTITITDVGITTTVVVVVMLGALGRPGPGTLAFHEVWQFC